MRYLIIILCVFYFQGITFSQIENYSLSSGVKAKYYQDFLGFLGEDGKTRLDVFIKVPYSSVQFIKTSEGFKAGYSVTASIYDEEEDNLITEKIWNEKIVAISFEQTLSDNNFNLSHRSFNLSPGKYFVKTSIRDKDSRNEYNSENVLNVKNYTVNPTISNLMLIEKRTVVEGSSKILPNVSRDVITDKQGIPLFFEIYSDSLAEYVLDYTVTDSEENEVHSEVGIEKVNAGSNQIFKTIDSLSLNIGNFVIKIAIKNEEGDVLDYSAKEFISRWEGVPASITDLDKAVDQLIYIASPEDISLIEESEDRFEKTERFLNFWKKRDTNPADEYNPVFNEYFNRVAFSNENFTTYSMEGWRSDRGMVLIILGVPDNVDRHPFEYYAKPYEVWQYYDLNRSFIFIDNSGFGDYRLSPDTPLYGDLYRFRY